MDFDPLQRGLGAFAFGFKRREPVTEQIVEIVLDHLLEAAELVVGKDDFPPVRLSPAPGPRRR
ncbi:hypothetical protein QEV83_04315 [Methylocapsa sp. D3K7]|uniref:hypothetical protein n=1 Tax=Methylocapsa sp. D3K7 TaxID=3041435 RepID=UPI00244EAF08|nr:hypothetical protein [Methylocapsa sp. D3K7]WGJ15505.1 hypothetical protein QEV83_04315 [Methylocapsa sp. D3K7]